MVVTGDIDHGVSYVMSSPRMSIRQTEAPPLLVPSLSHWIPPTYCYRSLLPETCTVPIDRYRVTNEIGTIEVTTVGGTASFNESLAATTLPGAHITATATNSFGSTFITDIRIGDGQRNDQLCFRVHLCSAGGNRRWPCDG